MRSFILAKVNMFLRKRGQLRHPAHTPYPTYEAALAACPEGGYGDADLVNVVLQKTLKYREELMSAGTSLLLSPTHAYSLCALLTAIAAPDIRVLDFGGACGAAYYLARALLPPSHPLRWIVVESPAMVHKAASAMATDELAFSSDVQEAAATLQRVDLLHTSGALQYLDNPRAHLATLVSLGATHMLFNRLSLTQGAHDIITVQESWLSENGPGPMPSGIPERKVRYPFICLQASAFYDALSKDYNIVMTFDDRSGMLPIPGEPIIGVGLLARLKREHGTACPL